MSEWSKLKELAEAATPGPWALDSKRSLSVRTPVANQTVATTGCDEELFARWNHNAGFIAAANPATILRLLAQNEAMAEQLRQLQVSPADAPEGH